MESDDDIARANRAKRGSPFLNTDQAAAYLKMSSRLLKRLRRAGTGPVFRRHSRFVQYLTTARLAVSFSFLKAPG